MVVHKKKLHRHWKTGEPCNCGFTTHLKSEDAWQLSPEDKGPAPTDSTEILSNTTVLGAQPIRALMQKFPLNSTHPPGPNGPEIPFIYAPEHGTVFLGPSEAYHHELIRKIPELAPAYPETLTRAPFLENPSHTHGRMEWPSRNLHFFGEQEPGVRQQVADALGSPYQEEEEDFALPGQAPESPSTGMEGFSKVIPDSRHSWPQGS